LSHTILYADDTNIIVTSTDYNDLHKTVNVTLQLISEWFQIIITFNNCNLVVTRWQWLFYMYRNMKKVTRKFKFGGLHEKHVVATWKTRKPSEHSLVDTGKSRKPVSRWPVVGPSGY